MSIKSYLWTLPFLSFIFGYQLLHLFISGPTIEVPNLLGKSASEALLIASNKNLCIKIIGQKEETEIPEGTILHQTPIDQKLKQSQSIYVLISKQPAKPTAPNLLNRSEVEVDKILADKNLKAKKYYIANCPSICFCQYPSPEQEIMQDKIILYFGSTEIKPCLFPNLKGETVENVAEFLNLYNLKIKVYRKGIEEERYNPESIIIKQKPLAGSIVNLKNITNVLVEIG